MIKIWICDDEYEWLAQLQNQIAAVLDISYDLTLFSSSMNLLESLKENSPDILITDIQMPQKDGIELAKYFHESYKHTQIIFSSVFTSYIQDIFTVDPVFYLLKPFSQEKIKLALNLAVSNLEERKESIEIFPNNQALSIKSNEINYVESLKKNVIIHEGNNQYNFIAKLDDIQEKLPRYFIRCHKSYLVNLNKIKRISNNEIELSTLEIVPVAKARFSSVRSKVLEFWEGNI